MRNYEHCIECEERTGRAGASDDSLYHGYSGPFCEDCFDAWPDNQVSQIILLRQELKQTQERVAELESTLESYEALKRMHRLENYPNELSARAWLLRKQAEAAEEAIVFALRTAGNVDPFEVNMHKFAKDYAQRLRQQANELENKQ